MVGGEIKQRLAAILAADAVGYARLMAADDQATVATLDAARAVFRSHIESDQGRVIDMAGDSVLAMFETAAGAVTAALGIQQALQVSTRAVPANSRRPFRIGVHLGDVIEKTDGTVYGDGVNIAARLQALAEPGGVMVSDMVHGAVRDRVSAIYEDVGEHNFKNIVRAVRVFRIVSNTDPDDVPIGRANGQTTKTTRRRWFAMGIVFLVITAIGLVAWLRPWKPDIEPADPAKLALALPDRPSIAVLSFENFSEDKTKGYFMEKFPVNNELGYMFYAANLAMLERTEDAARQAEMVLKLNPDFNLSGWRWINTYKSPADRRHLYDAAKRAGLPEYPQAGKPTSLQGNQE